MDARRTELVAAARRRLDRVGTTPPDALLALGLLPVSLGDVNAETTRLPLLAGLAVAACVAALAWRRRWPATTCLALAALHLVLSATTPGPWPPQLLIFAVLIGVYAAAAQLTGRRLVLTGAASLAMLWAANVVTAEGDPGDFLAFLLWGAPWLAGRLVRRQTLAAAAAATQAAEVLQRRDQDLREAREGERDRIARELHDVVAHAVSLMVVQAGAERLRLGPEAPQTRAVLDAVESSGRLALADLRTMLGLLRGTGSADDALAPQPQLADLPALVDRVRAAGLPVELQLDGPLAAPPALGLSAYRIVQEALTNVLKHAGPVPTRVQVRVGDAGIQVDVTSPLGSVVPQQRGGRGLLGMRERAALHGGEVACGPDGEDWAVHAVLPR